MAEAAVIAEAAMLAGGDIQEPNLRIPCAQDGGALVEEASNTFNKGKETILDFTNTEGTVTLVEGNILRVEYNPIIMKKGGGFNFD